MLAIVNFGYLWERKYIFWGQGGQNNKGHLIGYRGSGKSLVYVDFRTQKGIYILYDKDMQPIYIGEAGSGNQNLFYRLKAHKENHLWNRWEYFSWFGLLRANASGKQPYALDGRQSDSSRVIGTISDALKEIEGVLIQVLEPKLNKKGPVWKTAKGKTNEYFQDIDDRVWQHTTNDIIKEVKQLNAAVKKLTEKIK